MQGFRILDRAGEAKRIKPGLSYGSRGEVRGNTARSLMASEQCANRGRSGAAGMRTIVWLQWLSRPEEDSQLLLPEAPTLRFIGSHKARMTVLL